VAAEAGVAEKQNLVPLEVAVSLDRTSRIGQVAAFAALALVASACTGTTSAADHTPAPSHRTRPATTGPAGTSTTPTPQPPASSPAAPTTAQPSATPATDPCVTEQLSVSLKPGGVAAGSTYQRLVFTNTGGATCSLTGFPGVSYVTNRSGNQIGAAAERMGPAHTVSVEPGGSVTAVLQSTDAQNYPQDRCGQTTAGGLRIYPPNQTTALFVRDRALTCSDSSVNVLHIGSVRAS
jgi:hypothetical protein